MRSGLAILCVGLAACGPAVGVPGQSTDDATGSMTEPGVPTTSGVTTPTTDASTSTPTTGPGTTTGSRDTDGPNVTFIGAGEYDVFGPDECDVFAQDCPGGDKCMPWANDGGDEWNATRCSPVATDPAAPGEPCTVEGSAVSGIDDCDADSMCFYVDSATGTGVCVPMCHGNPEAPLCPDPRSCFSAYEELVNLCFERCDPTGGPCSDGSPCAFYEQSEAFACHPAWHGTAGFGDACDIDDCSPGLACVPPDLVSPSCDQEAPGCCTRWCDLDNPTCPGAGLTCQSYFGDAEPPADYAHVGVCVL